jgi:hypothetical protein
MLRSPPKHMPAAPPAPHEVTSRHPRSTPLKPCLIRFQPLCPLSRTLTYDGMALCLRVLTTPSISRRSALGTQICYRVRPLIALQPSPRSDRALVRDPSTRSSAPRDLLSRLPAIQDGLLRFVGTCAGIVLPHTETTGQAVVALAPTRTDLCQAICWMVTTRLHAAAPAHGHAAAGVTCPLSTGPGSSGRLDTG